MLIKGFDQKLGKEIDELIAQKVDLQKIVTQQLSKFENPIPNNFDRNIHLSVQPENLLFNIKEKGEHYGLTVHTSFKSEINWEKRSITKIFSELPHIQEFDGQTSNSEIKIPIKVDYDMLVAMLSEQFAQVKVMDEDLQISNMQMKYSNGLMHVSAKIKGNVSGCLLYTSPSPRDQRGSRMPSSA